MLGSQVAVCDQPFCEEGKCQAAKKSPTMADEQEGKA